MSQLLRIAVFVPFLNFWSGFLWGQNEGNIWYFGVNAGIDFNSGEPVPLVNGQIPISEGCSSISDDSGNLLFYTNGVDIWNKNHEIMTNGSGIKGGLSITQSAIIIPKPGSSTRYFVITTNPTQGLEYSEIDISLSSGLGEVTANKNILIHSNSSEKLTAVRHQNGIDCWIISHEIGTNNFNVFLVSPTGITLTPVISSIGSVISTDGEGYMKASIDGSLLALANLGMDEVQIFDFDNTNGTINNPKTISGFLYYGPYGIEFSPSCRLLYVSDANDSLSNIYQYDLTTADISGSSVLVTTLNGYTGAMQLGPNGKIYITRTDSSSLSVINSPNIYGTGCGFILNGIYLGGKHSFIGLPSFVNDIYNQVCEVNEIQNFEISIFPNPTNDLLTIQSNFSDNLDFYIFSSQGQLVYNKKEMNSSIHLNTESFMNGTYLVEIHLNNSPTKIIKKLIINH